MSFTLNNKNNYSVGKKSRFYKQILFFVMTKSESISLADQIT